VIPQKIHTRENHTYVFTKPDIVREVVVVLCFSWLAGKVMNKKGQGVR
jgi:hypothetical protein